MALDLERVSSQIDIFRELTPARQDAYLQASHGLVNFIAEELPALCELDQAAVAYVIARLFSALSEARLCDASELILDTALSYSLASAILLGMLPGADAA